MRGIASWWSHCAAAAVVSAPALAAPPAFHDAVKADAPMLWYRFDEPAGAGEAVNYGSLGAAYNGVYFNGVGLGAASAFGDTAACFTADQQQYVESKAVAPAGLTGNPTFTAEAVVRIFNTAQSPVYAPFLHWGGPFTGQSVYFSMYRNSRDRAFVGFYNGGLFMTNPFGVGEWVHLVWVRDSGGGTHDDRTGSTLWVNGELAALQVDGTLPGAGVPAVTATTFRIQRATDFVRYFSGNVDEVALYSRMLTPAEIAEHYRALTDGAPCRADLNGDGSLDFFDFLTFQNLFAAGDPRADCDPGGCAPALDFFDFLCFQNAFAAGCP